MASRWEATKELKEKYTLVLKEFINKVELVEDELPEIDLSDSGLSPYTLQKMLEDMGYEETNTETNGWQWDFWITMEKDGYKPLWIMGTGITFTLVLSAKED